jgi:acyl dehydratase
MTDSLGRLYLRAFVTARGRRGDRLPELQSEASVRADHEQLAAYAQVCGFRQSDVLPPTYPHVLAFRQQISLMVDRSFPFALAGMVHVANRISQHRPLRVDESLTLRVHAQDLRPHPRGRQFDMITEGLVGGQPVWSETSTYLRRERPRPGSRPASRTGERPTQPERPPPSAVWRVSKSIGRRYAAVSGDINPIHLNPLVARLFGFPRAIAHGMWLKARCIAALEGRLPDAVTVEVEFKSPLLLPSTVAFSSTEANSGWTFGVVHASSGRPHLNGHTAQS